MTVSDEQRETLVTIVLIDRIIAAAHDLRDLRDRDTSDVAVQEALCDLRDDAAVKALMEAAGRASRSPFR
jgi:hypothetical protein